MFPRITAARYMTGYTVWLLFSDGTKGVVDLAAELKGPMFAPLREFGVFAQVRLHPDLKTLIWPNGADLAPEFLHARLRTAA